MLNLEKLQPMPNAPQMYPQMTMQQQQQQQKQDNDSGMVYQLTQDLRPNTTNYMMPDSQPNNGMTPDSRPKTSAPNVIVVNANAPMPLGHEPQRMTCPECNVKMVTRLDYRSTYRTHLIALGLCAFGLICLIPLPYCLNSCRNLEHYCSNCDQYLGIIKM